MIGLMLRAECIATTDIAELTVQLLDDRDIVVTMPEMGFAVTYRKDGNFPMLVATDILRDGLGPTRLNFLAQAWKAAYSKARALG